MKSFFQAASASLHPQRLSQRPRWLEEIMREATNVTAMNMAFAGSDYKQLWLTGVGGIARVTMNWEGMY